MPILWKSFSQTRRFTISLQNGTRCGNLWIFRHSEDTVEKETFLPLRFYVKTILTNFEFQKLPFWPCSLLWILIWAYVLERFARFPKYLNSKSPKLSIIISNLISRKNLSGSNVWKFKKLELRKLWNVKFDFTKNLMSDKKFSNFHTFSWKSKRQNF